MLPILHTAHHLFREDAYREYCWSVDAWGAYQPASFIYLCFEAFRDAAARESLLLITPVIFSVQGEARKGFPTRSEREWASRAFKRDYGLICRLETQADAKRVEEILQRGDNVIALLPNEILGLYYGGGSEKQLPEAAACLESL